MNWPIFATPHSEWLPYSPPSACDLYLPWLSPLSFSESTFEFSATPSSSALIQPPTLPLISLASFPTLAELLSTLLGPTRPAGPIQLSEEHTLIATEWIISHYQTISDIPEVEFEKYVKQWQEIANDILKTKKASKEVQNAAKAKIPRPSNLYFLFKNIAVGKLHGQLASQLWQALQGSTTQIQVWRSAANKLGQLHKVIFPDYKFTPVHTKKAKSKIGTQTKSYKETLTRGGKRRRAPKSPQLPTAPSGSSQGSGKPMDWLKDTNDNWGYWFPGGSQVEYNLGQDLQFKPSEFFPDFPVEDFSLFSTGTPFDNFFNTFAGDSDIAFDPDAWIRDYNDSFQVGPSVLNF